MTRRLMGVAALVVGALSAAGAPTARASVVALWADAGIEPGNHTYSHHSLNRESLADFQTDVLKGEVFFEGVEQTVLGRPLSHVLLLHANALNGDHFGRLATMIRDRGYRFIALDEALRDDAWPRPDTFAGARGISWLHRSEVTETGRRSPSSDPPAWVVKAYEAAVASSQ